MSHALKILILEDEMIEALSLKMEFETRGMGEVFIASTYKKAMEIYRKEAPEVAIVDINLNDEKNGIDFISATSTFNKVILLSGYRIDLYEEELKQISFDHYLEKPIDAEQLVACLR